MKKICVFVGSRANYSSIKSVLQAIQNSKMLELQLIVGASALLDKYGSVINLMIEDGFEISAKVYMLIDGETPATMAKSTGLGLLELPNIFEKLKPSLVLTVGDRFETMATTLAAAYMNIPIAHTMGGEVSGSIDESIRHAITKFANIHFPACKDAYDRIIKLGEVPENVYLVGCPRIDLIDKILKKSSINFKKFFDVGVGPTLDMNKDVILVSQHPVTSEYGRGELQIQNTLEAIYELKLQAIILWPNADAGSDQVSKGIRRWREKKLDKKMHFFKNLSIENYVWLMKKVSCLVGNSSSGIREGAFIGTPTVNIGSRQMSRQRGLNVIDVSYNKNEIKDAITKQINHGPYKQDSIYGNGFSSLKIVKVLEHFDISSQKKINY